MECDASAPCFRSETEATEDASESRLLFDEELAHPKET